MNIDAILHDSLGYTRDALWERWVRWLYLLIAYLIFPLFMGYSVKMYRGGTTAPEPENWVELFIDGLKLLLIGIIYLLPVLIVALVAAFFIWPLILDTITNPGPMAISALVAVGGTGLLAVLLLWLALSLLGTVGIVRFARTESIREAFNFRAIIDQIRAIGWGNYILALTILWLVSLLFNAIVIAIQSVPFAGWLIGLLLMPAWGIYSVRFITLIYETGIPRT